MIFTIFKLSDISPYELSASTLVKPEREREMELEKCLNNKMGSQIGNSL